MNKKNKAMLRKAVVLSMMLSMGVGGALTANADTVTSFIQPITGESTNTEYKDAGVQTADDTYVFNSDVTIAPTAEGYKAAGLDTNSFTYSFPSIIRLDSGSVTDADHTIQLTQENAPYGLNGVYADYQNVTITAKKLSMNLSVSAAQNLKGIVHSRSNSLTVHGAVDIHLKSKGRAFGVSSEDRGTINVDGGVIQVDPNSRWARTLMATGKGTINFNMNGNQPGSNEVQLDGDIQAKNEINAQESKGVINLGLTTATSYLHGLSLYVVDRNDRGSFPQEDMGIVNMYLQNGATWQNAQHFVGRDLQGFTGSRLTSLTGGATADKAGIIYQKDARPITVDSYAGHEVVIFDHDTDPTTIKGGDFIVAKAAPNSGVVLRTGAENVNDGNKDAVLTNLAKKITYKAYAGGEKNLTGSVEVAEGLTSAAEAKFLGDLDFDVNSGVGVYKAKETPSAPEETGAAATFTTPITGATSDQPYVSQKIRQDSGNYVFSKDATITNAKPITADNVTYEVQAPGHTLTLAVPEAGGPFTGVSATSPGAGFVPFPRAHYNPATNLTITADKLVISGDGKAEQTVGLSRMDDGGKLTVNGALDINLSGTGTVVGMTAKSGGIINVNGDTTIAIDKNAAKGAAVEGAGGTININATDSGAQAHTVKIDGDILASQSIFSPSDKLGNINIGLANNASYLHGVAAYTDENHENGHFPYAGRSNTNLYLQNGGTWINEAHGANVNFDGFTGSKVTKLTGGSSDETAGVIQQLDSRPLTIDNYSGNTFIMYKHGSDPVEFAAGDVTIGKAATGSQLTLVTSSDGIAENKRADVLESLAHKLYYLGAKENVENNLQAKVRIAEGLTSSANTVVFDAVKYNTATGQGYVKKADANPGAVGDVYDYTDPITQKEADTMYKRGGVLQDNGEYVFKENGSIKVAGKVQDAIHNTKDLVINAGEHDLAVSNTSTFNNTDRAIDIDNHSLTMTAKNITASVSGPDRVEAIRVENAHASFNGDVTVSMNGSGYILGSFVKGAAQADFNGTYTSNGLDGNSGYKPDKAIDTVFYDRYEHSNVYAGNGAVVNLNGAVDIGVAHGAGIVSNQGGSVVNINKGGVIKTDTSRGRSLPIALNAQSATINANMLPDKSDAADNKFVIVGNVIADDGAANKDEPNKTTTINVGLGTKDSSWTGRALVSFKKASLDAGNKGDINVYMKNGAVWNNTKLGAKLPDPNAAAGDKTGLGSTVNILKSDTGANRGVINQNDTVDLKVDRLQGEVLVNYTHDNATPTQFAAGNFIVNHGDPGAKVTMRTTADGVDLINADAINGADKVMAALANKLTYLAYTDANGKERNLTGQVEIAEGLTSSAVSKKIGDIAFDSTTGQGSYKATAPEEPSSHQAGGDESHGQAGGGDSHGQAGGGESHGQAGGGDSHGQAGGGDSHGQAGGGDSHGQAGGGESHGQAGGGESHGQAGGGQGSEVQPTTGSGTVVQPPAVSEQGISVGNPDTAIMRGVRASMISPVITMRETINDIYKRLGDIRYNNSNEGAWALIGGGKASFDKDNVTSEYKYNDLEAGYDTAVGNGWKAGLMLQRIQGDVTGTFATGNAKAHAVGLYASHLAKNGAYTDIITKYGHLSNDVAVDNGAEGALNIKGAGNFKSDGFLLSMEHGIRMDRANGFYVEPQLELSYMHMNGGNYDLNTTFNNGTALSVKQDAFSSLVGRLGYAVGYQSTAGTAYVKVSANHEFLGRYDTTYSAPGQPTKTIRTDLGDTWLSLQLGGTRVLSKQAYLYANALTTFGGHYKNTWKANLGFRFAF